MKGKRLRKRFTGLVLAGVMVLSSAVPANVPAATAQAAEESASPRAAAYEQITSGSSSERSTTLSMVNNRATITVETTLAGSFRTSVIDGNKYITTTSGGEGWYAAAEGDSIYYENGGAGENVIQGHIYEVRYTKDGFNYTIEYYDVSAGKSLYTYHANHTNLTGDTIKVYAKAVAGTYRVYNCSAAEAGFSEGELSTNVQLYNHGTDRTRYVPAPDNSIPSGYDVNPATQGSAKDGVYDKYFLKDSLQEVNITIKNDNLDYILQNAASKESALADSVTVGDQTVKYVGLKAKGNYTRWETNASTSDRFSFTVNFGKYVKKKYGYSDTQNFFGCRKISFNNFYFDKTMMKEYNALRLMTEMGLPTPQYSLAKLYINGEYYGVYFMLESMDSTVLEQYYNTSSKNLSSFLTKPSYYSPRYYRPDLDDCISADGEITWDALVNKGYIIVNPDGSYDYDRDRGLTFYAGLWENDEEIFQDVAKDLPTVLTWLYRLTQLSNGKDFQGNRIDVNSEKYLELLGQIMDVDETVKYFATHSFVVQMDNLFTCRQNYGLYVNPGGQSVMVPWDYDLAWGCFGEPGDGESIANWNVDKLYNNATQDDHYYTDILKDYYAGSLWDDYEYYDIPGLNGSGYPLFNVIYQNKSLMEKFHTYMKDCSKVTSLGGITSTGSYYEAGRFGATIDGLYDETVEAASEKLADNVYYLQYNQPNDVKLGLKGLKQIIALRSVGVWLQLNKINATVTGYGYPTGCLGNDADRAEYTTDGNNIAVVDDTTGIFTIADYAKAAAGPELSAEILSVSSEEYKAIEALMKKESSGSETITVYALSDTRKAKSDYQVYLPVSSENAVIYSYSADAGTLKQLEAVTYDDCTKKVVVPELSYLVVSEMSYQAEFTADNGVESIDVYYTQNYDAADETGVTSAIARNGETGASDVSGEGQINFKVNLKDGYKISSVSVDKNYKNIKTPADTEGPSVYRITKVTGDLAVTVETVKATEYKAVFDKDDGVESIDLYYTSADGDPDESNVESAVVRNSKTGDADMTGDGQINFRVNLKNGFMIKSVTISGGYYKNVKGPDETGAENVYRVTKILGDVKVTVKTQEYTDKYEAAFVKDEGVSSVDTYYTQDYSAASEENVAVAYARSSTTGELDTTGEGQVNFKVNLMDGYAIKSVTADTNYKNIKEPVDTGAVNVYRITKVTGNVNITIVTEKKQTGVTPTPTPTQTPTQTTEPDKTPTPTQTAEPDKTQTPAQTAEPDKTPTVCPTKDPTSKDDQNKVTDSPGNGQITPDTTANSPAKVTSLKLKAKKKSFIAKWKKISGVKGYQIQYALSKKKLNKGKKKNTKKATITIKKLKKNKRYYVRVRAYKVVGNSKVYGEWSAVKRIKIKK